MGSVVRENYYTKRSLQRRIEAAKAAGLVVVAIAPDFTLITADPNNGHTSPGLSPGSPSLRLTSQPQLRDAREKLG
jgi:hypothetical protein